MKTAAQISFNMSRVRCAGSVIERRLGRALWSAGVRYRKQYRTLPGRPDFVVVSARIAIFCDSSFWHGRGWPKAAAAFKSNRAFWLSKIKGNIARDKKVNRELARLGWRYVRFWDDVIMKSPDRCVRRVLQLIAERQRVGFDVEIRRR